MIQKYLFLDLFDGFDLVLQDKSLQSGLLQLSMMSIQIYGKSQMQTDK